MKLGNLDNDVWPNLYGKILITKNINEPAASLIAFVSNKIAFISNLPIWKKFLLVQTLIMLLIGNLDPSQ